jgi:phosphopantetheine adenylyltransferase
MNRKELLQASLTEEKNTTLVIANTTKADAKFLVRAVRDLNDLVADLKEKLEIRLSSTEPLDKSVIEGLYFNIKDALESIALYEEFEKEYIA